MKTLYFYLEKPYRYFVVKSVKYDLSVIDKGIFTDLNDMANSVSSYDEVVAVIPGDLVSILDVAIPIRSRKKALQAVPFILEEQLAGNIDDLYFALVDWNPSESSTVGVIKGEEWHRYIQLLEEHNMDVHRIVPDFDLLSLQDDDAAIFFIEEGSERVLIKFRQNGIVKGMAISLDELSFLVDELEINDKQVICNDERLFSQLVGLKSIDAESIHQITDRYIEEICVKQQKKAKSLALHTSSQTKQTLEKSKPWLMVAISCLVVTVFLDIMFDVHEYRVLKIQEKVLSERTVEIFKQSFPNVQRIVDARAQFQQELNVLKGNTRGSQEFLFLLDNVVRSVLKIEILVEEVFYTSSALNVVLRADDFQVFDKFTSSLTKNGKVSYERLSSDSQGGKVTAKYRLSVSG